MPSTEFDEAATKVRRLSSVDPEILLQLYGLFKQATTGDLNPTQSKPSDFLGGKKWEKRTQLIGMDPKQAETDYVDLANTVTGEQ